VVVVVDDGSTDDSVAVIRSWIARYPFIRFLQNERNLGFHASFRRALDVATSDFIYSGAADDRVLPGFFEGAMQLAGKHPDTGVICGQFISVDPSGRPLSTHGLERFQESVFLEPARYREEVLKVEPATHSLSAATMIRRQSLLDAGGYPVELGSWGDTFAIQAVGLRYGFCYWPHPAMEWTIMDHYLIEYCVAPEMRKSVKASAFSASLEMVREGLIDLRQDAVFAPLWVRWREEPSQPPPSGESSDEQAA
jgi:glycosyltransferase involved in cell wall biosynthesis